jgi:hypothetical protein
MAAISAEIYTHLARGILPLRANSMAAIRSEAIDQRRGLLAELERGSRSWSAPAACWRHVKSARPRLRRSWRRSGRTSRHSVV